MKYFQLIFLLTFLFSSKNINSQTVSNFRVEQMLPSAESISKIKNVVRPQEVYNGIPKISIPLWNNENSDYSIVANYHAQGIQVNEEASSIGLGWSLEAGGVIARVVRGYPDDMLEKGYLNMSLAQKALYNVDIDSYSNLNVNTLKTVYDIDCSPDIFYYNFHGIKGKFVFDETGEIQCIPKNNLKIEEIYADTYIRAFVIKTPDGIIYEFTRIEHAEITSGASVLGYSNYKSAWYLTSVKNLEKEIVSYQYNYCDVSTTRKLFDYKYYGNSENSISVDIKFTVPRLYRISDSKSRAEFLIDWSTGKLGKINIKAQDYTSSEYEESFDSFTSISFTYGNYSIDGGVSASELRTRRLDEVTIGSYNQKKYTFEYDNMPIPNINSKEQDLWGYFSNNTASTLLPKLYFSSGIYESIGAFTANVNSSGANRVVNATAIQAGVLKKVINPAGGTTEYVYEPQSFNYHASGNIAGGGLRVKDIVYSDPNNTDYPTKTISYKYVDFNTNLATGVLLAKPNFSYFLDNPDYTDISDKTYVYSNYAYGLNTITGNPVFYSQVTIDDNGTTFHVMNFDIPNSDLGYSYSSYLMLDYLNTRIRMMYLNKDIDDYYNYEWNTAYLQSESFYNFDREKVKEVVYKYRNFEASKAIHGFYVGPKENFDEDLIPTESDMLYKFYYWSAWRLLDSKTIYSYEPGNTIPVSTKTNSFTYDDVSCEYRQPITIQATDVNGYTHIKQYRYPYHYTSTYNASAYVNELTDRLFDKPIAYHDIYKISYLDEEYILYNIVPSLYYSSITNNVPLGVSDDVEAIEILKKRGIVSKPIEVVEKITFDGQTQVLNAFITKYKELDNLCVVPVEDLIIEGPLDNSAFQLSQIVNDQLQINNNYKRFKKYETYNDIGQLVEEIGADGVKTSYKYSTSGSYLLAKATNANYIDIEDYTGSNEDIRTNINGFVTTYAYKPLSGVKRETDLRGRSTYYIYDLDGNLVAVKDHDKNIREIYSQNFINGEKSVFLQIDPETDPDKNELFLDADASAQINVLYSQYCNSIRIALEILNPAFDYFIQYPEEDPDLNILWPVNNSFIDHIPPQYKGLYPIVVTVKKDGNIIDEYQKLVNIDNTVIDAVYTYNIKDENGDIINNFTSGATYNEVSFTVKPSKGIGTYSVEWDVKRNGVDYPDLEKITYDVRCGQNVSSKIFNEYGTYIVTCKIKSGSSVKTQTWNFTISNYIPENFIVMFNYKNSFDEDYFRIDGLTLDYLKMQIKISSGTGTFSVKWEYSMNGGATSVIYNSVAADVLTDGPVFNREGDYYLKCTVSQGDQVIVTDWNFTIGRILADVVDRDILIR